MPIPTPKAGEDQSTFIGRCMGSDVMNKEFPDQKQRSAVCHDSWRKKHGGKKPENILIDEKLEFSSPITVVEAVKKEDKEDKDSVRIKGTMIKASTTRNGNTYLLEELESAKFNGKPREDIQPGDNILGLNHTGNIQDNIGTWNPIWTGDGYDFEAVVLNTPYHPGMVEMVKKGLVKHVSIESIAKEVKEENGNIVGKGLDILGLDIVKTPGYPGAWIAMAEKFKPTTEEVEEIKVIDMVEEEKPKEEPEQPKEEPKEEPKADESLKAEVKELRESLDALKAREEEEEKEKEALREEIKGLKETKGKVTEEAQSPYDFELQEKTQRGGKEYYAKDARKKDGSWLY